MFATGTYREEPMTQVAAVTGVDSLANYGVRNHL
ncbi:MAG: hypothetical protein ACI86M_002923, partial [Saprospiraceae bacterium]